MKNFNLSQLRNVLTHQTLRVEIATDFTNLLQELGDKDSYKLSSYYFSIAVENWHIESFEYLLNIGMIDATELLISHIQYGLYKATLLDIALQYQADPNRLYYAHDEYLSSHVLNKLIAHGLNWDKAFKFLMSMSLPDSEQEREELSVLCHKILTNIQDISFTYKYLTIKISNIAAYKEIITSVMGANVLLEFIDRARFLEEKMLTLEVLDYAIAQGANLPKAIIILSNMRWRNNNHEAQEKINEMLQNTIVKLDIQDIIDNKYFMSPIMLEHKEIMVHTLGSDGILRYIESYHGQDKNTISFLDYAITQGVVSIEDIKNDKIHLDYEDIRELKSTILNVLGADSLLYLIITAGTPSSLSYSKIQDALDDIFTYAITHGANTDILNMNYGGGTFLDCYNYPKMGKVMDKMYKYGARCFSSHKEELQTELLDKITTSMPELVLRQKYQNLDAPIAAEAKMPYILHHMALLTK